MFHRSRIPIRALLTEGLLPSGLQRRIYARRGYRIAPDVSLAPGVVIDAEEVEIGPGASIGFGTVLRGRRIKIGRRVSIGSFSFLEGRVIEIGDDTVLREQIYVGGPEFPDSALRIGRRVRVFQTCFLNPSRPLSIGDDTGVGGRSSIFTHGSWQSMVEGYPVAFEPVTIGRRVWLPWHVFILPGVEIGDGATIGAGSVINRAIPAGALAAGVPAKVLREAAEWPRPLDADAAWAVVRRIFSDLAAHFEMNGVPSTTQEDATGLRMVLDGLAAGSAVRVDREARDFDVPEPVVTVLEDRERETVLGLRSNMRRGPRLPVGLEVEDFLSRYGLRFQPVEEL